MLTKRAATVSATNPFVQSASLQHQSPRALRDPRLERGRRLPGRGQSHATRGPTSGKVRHHGPPPEYCVPYTAQPESLAIAPPMLLRRVSDDGAANRNCHWPVIGVRLDLEPYASQDPGVRHRRQPMQRDADEVYAMPGPVGALPRPLIVLSVLGERGRQRLGRYGPPTCARSRR